MFNWHRGVKIFILVLQTLENIVRLTCDVVEKHEGGEVKKQRTYTYSEIRNLQSKLTLVAGEKQRDNMDIIQNFDEVCMTDKIKKGFYSLTDCCYDSPL